MIDLPRDTCWTWVSMVAVLRAGCAFTNTKSLDTVNPEFLHRLEQTDAICVITTAGIFDERNLNEKFPDSCGIM